MWWVSQVSHCVTLRRVLTVVLLESTSLVAARGVVCRAPRLRALPPPGAKLEHFGGVEDHQSGQGRGERDNARTLERLPDGDAANPFEGSNIGHAEHLIHDGRRRLLQWASRLRGSTWEPHCRHRR